MLSANIVSSVMTFDEARQCVDMINAHLHTTRALVLDLYERQGWAVLGYSNWRECAVAEFGQSQTHLYRLLEAAQVERVISPIGEIGVIPESHLRPLTVLRDFPELQREAYREAIETAPDGKVTAAHIDRVVESKQPQQDMGRWILDNPATIPPHIASPEPAPVAPVDPMAVHFSSATPEWYTPSHIVNLVVDFFEQIDLDPCSNSHESPNVPAGMAYTEENDGLKQPWFGRVYMNPPYGDEIVGWVKKLHEEYQNGDIEAAIALLPARMDTRWWNDYVMPYAMCFIRGRLTFVGAPNSAPFPSVLVYYGDDIGGFMEATTALGSVVTVYGHTPGDRLLEDFGDHLGAAPSFDL